MPAFLEQKRYLRTLADPHLNARYSQGAQRRAAQLQQFLRQLCEAGLSDGAARPELLVFSRRDWAFSYPFGLPFCRAAAGVYIVAAGSYPERFLHRFDDVLVRGVQAGAEVPGDVREYLDVLVGLEWGHAALRLRGLYSPAPWLNELLAAYLYIAALRAAELGGVIERFAAWNYLALKGSGHESLALNAFAYPRAKNRLGAALWFQGRIGLQADALAQNATGELLLAEVTKLLGAGVRDDLAQALGGALPELEPWLASFGAAEAPPQSIS